MKLDRTGIILFVDKYKECVSFYRDILKLPVLFQKKELFCFEFGGSYLMVEPQESRNVEKSIEDKRDVCLRFNVSNIKTHCKELSSLGVQVDIEEYDWGTIARFKDPDGNNCSLKDSGKFELQIKDFRQEYDM